MASSVGPVALVSQRRAHKAGGSIKVDVFLRWLSHHRDVLTGPLPFSAARVSPNVLFIQYVQTTNSQVVWCYKILCLSFSGISLTVNISPAPWRVLPRSLLSYFR